MFAALVVAAAVFGACHETQHDHGAAASAVPAGLNPVQNEMRLLLDAMRDTVTGIANGKVTTVPESLHKVHAAKEATAAALKAGSYKPPKNPDQIARFVELDEAFHGDLEKLVEAASKNDVPGTGRALGQALSSCQGCHEQFRL
ncbi:MAG: cytochrome c [Myxococcales bacterium]|nr:cytochrome c [Myxococcales bacterium]